MAALNPLPTWQRRGLHLASGALAASGALWLALHYGVGPDADGLPRPAEAWLMRLHGGLAFAGLFFGGVVAAQHVPRGWHVTHAHLRTRARWAFQRRSGLALCTLGALLAASAYALYYFAPEWLRAGLGWAHSAFGLALAALLSAHGARRGTLRQREPK